MTDDLTLLASTYLDGEATPDERARVEADADLLAEVERLRTARATLLDARWFERPGDDAREAAIAAALAAWDVAEAGRTETVPAGRRSPVVTFERRRTHTRWLTAAAAAVVAVAGLGVIAAQSGGGGEDESSTAFDAASASTEAPADAASEFTEQGGPPSAAADTLAGSGVAADDAAGDADSAAVAEEAQSPDATEAPAAPEETALSQLAAQPTALAVMQTPEDLGVAAADAKAAVERDTGNDVLARPCSAATFDDIDTYVAIGHLSRPDGADRHRRRGRRGVRGRSRHVRDRRRSARALIRLLSAPACRATH